MFLSRIHVNPRCREARRDLSDPYQFHSTLCRAFSTPEMKCPANEFLWRLEPEASPAGYPRILVQSRGVPNWAGISVVGWLEDADRPIDLLIRLKLDLLHAGQRFRFRVRANPCVTRNGKRLGLLRLEDQQTWVERKGLQHGFGLPHFVPSHPSESSKDQINVRISGEHMLRCTQHSGNSIRILSVLYEGILEITDPDKFRNALVTGIGHGKAMGLGLLSVVPTP